MRTQVEACDSIRRPVTHLR